jgi:hypothetical protein
VTDQQKIEYILQYITKYNDIDKFFNSKDEIYARPIIMGYLHDLPALKSAILARDLFLFKSFTDIIEADSILLKKWSDLGDKLE